MGGAGRSLNGRTRSPDRGTTPDVRRLQVQPDASGRSATPGGAPAPQAEGTAVIGRPYSDFAVPPFPVGPKLVLCARQKLGWSQRPGRAPMSAVRSAWAAGAPPWVALRPLASGCTWSRLTPGGVPRSGERVRLFSDLPAPPTFFSCSVLARSPFAPSCGASSLPGALARSLPCALACTFPPAHSRRSPAPAATAWLQWRPIPWRS